MRSRRQRSPIRAARRALSLKLPKSPPPKIHACLRHLWRAAGAAAKGAGVAASGALDALIRVALLLDGAARWAAASSAARASPTPARPPPLARPAARRGPAGLAPRDALRPGGLVVTTALAASFAWALVAQCASLGLAASATVVFASCCLPEPPKKPADEYFAPPPRDEAAAAADRPVCSCSSSSSPRTTAATTTTLVDVGAECACDDAEWTAISSWPSARPASSPANAELIKEREMLGLEAGDAADLIEARDRRLRKRAPEEEPSPASQHSGARSRDAAASAASHAAAPVRAEARRADVRRRRREPLPYLASPKRDDDAGGLYMSALASMNGPAAEEREKKRSKELEFRRLLDGQRRADQKRRDKEKEAKKREDEQDAAEYEDRNDFDDDPAATPPHLRRDRSRRDYDDGGDGPRRAADPGLEDHSPRGARRAVASPSPEDRRSHEAVDKLQTMYDQLLAEQETLKDKLADLEDEKRDGGRRGRQGRRPARATADARRAQRTRERDGDASEGDASRAQSQQSRRWPDRSFASGARRLPTSRTARAPRRRAAAAAGDAPGAGGARAARNRWGGVVDEAEEAKKAARRRGPRAAPSRTRRPCPACLPRHGRPVPKPSPEKPAPRKQRAGKPARWAAAGRRSRRRRRRRRAAARAGRRRSGPSPRRGPRGPDAAAAAARRRVGRREPELRSTPQWWPNTDLALLRRAGRGPQPAQRDAGVARFWGGAGAGAEGLLGVRGADDDVGRRRERRRHSASSSSIRSESAKASSCIARANALRKHSEHAARRRAQRAAALLHDPRGNLSPAIHGDMLRSIFGHFGTIVDIRLIAQNGPASYGFVDYATEAAAQAALSMTGTEFDGRRLRVELAAAAPARPRHSPAPRSRASAASGGSHEIFVGGLSLGMLSAEPSSRTSRFGAVVDANAATNRATGAGPRASRSCASPRRARRRGGAGRRAPRRRRPHAQRRVQQPRADRWRGAPRPRAPRAGAAKVKAEARDRRRRRRSASSSSSRSRSPRGGASGPGAATGSRSESRRSRDDGKPAVGDGRGIAVDALFDAAPKLEEYARKVEQDTRATCGGFGTIRSVVVPRPRVASQRVWVEFDDAREAAAAAASLASRTYDGRTLAVEIVDARRARSAKPAEPPAAKAPRLAADAAYHGAQHKLLQARVDELEAELEAARASAKKDRDFHSSRVAALTKRCEDLEKDRDGALL
ncbi:RNA-binding protein [Aureococcus anophagefferens]|uniref:RNA-binding protein n=1 Tax=Aureococcus anophagefferens TaxID=44056 RepID=A0ABR1G4D2_AURAN